MSKIILKGIGRGKINREINVENPIVDGKPKHNEQAIAPLALREFLKYVTARSFELIPNMARGAGEWDFFVTKHVKAGEVQIII